MHMTGKGRVFIENATAEMMEEIEKEGIALVFKEQLSTLFDAYVRKDEFGLFHVQMPPSDRTKEQRAALTDAWAAVYAAIGVPKKGS